MAIKSSLLNTDPLRSRILIAHLQPEYFTGAFDAGAGASRACVPEGVMPAPAKQVAVRLLTVGDRNDAVNEF
jgi:hypothetical protein